MSAYEEAKYASDAVLSRGPLNAQPSNLKIIEKHYFSGNKNSGSNSSEKQQEPEGEDPWITKREIEIRFDEEESEHPDPFEIQQKPEHDKTTKTLWTKEKKNERRKARRLSKKSTRDHLPEEEDKNNEHSPKAENKGEESTPKNAEHKIKLKPKSDEKYVQIRQLWEANNRFCCGGYLLKGPK